MRIPLSAAVILWALSGVSVTAVAATPWNAPLLPAGTPGAAQTVPFTRVTHEVWTSRGTAHRNSTVAIQAQCAVASYADGIPPDLLLAIAITESGRAGRPWPWTLDVDGDPFYLPSRAALLREAQQALRNGHTRIDIGPMQVDWRYHGALFPSLASITHPFMNIAAAGHILAHLEARTGNWWQAVALYHSGTPTLGRPYMWHVYHIYRRLRAGRT